MGQPLAWEHVSGSRGIGEVIRRRRDRGNPGIRAGRLRPQVPEDASGRRAEAREHREDRLLGHAHSRGVVHRDVKPANIMFDHDGRVMLTDFGISKALQSASVLTGTGVILGTPHFMSPEQAKGHAVDGRADQYSLAVVGYRLLTGSLPFIGESVHTIMYRHIVEEAPRVSALRPDVPPYLSASIERALAKDPNSRYPTMEEFASDIWPEQAGSVEGKTPPKPFPKRSATPPVEHRATSAAPTTPLSAGRTHRATPPKRRTAFIGGILALALVGVAVAGYFVLQRRGAAPHNDQSQTSTVAPPVTQTPPTQPRETTATTSPAQNPPAPTESTTAKRPSPTRQPARRTTTPPPVVTQPPVDEGYLTIDSDPSGEVFIDGVDAGPTVLYKHAVKPGDHTVRIESPGYKTFTQRIQVIAGNEVSKRFSLIPE